MISKIIGLINKSNTNKTLIRNKVQIYFPKNYQSHPSFFGTTAFVLGGVTSIYLGCSYWKVSNWEKDNKFKSIGLKYKEKFVELKEVYKNKDLFSIWNALHFNKRLIYSIVGINLAIFGLWKVPSLGNFMVKHFLDHPSSNRYYTMLTSAFSHQGLLHLSFNMLAFTSFGVSLCNYMGPEQFLAFYLSSCIIASCTTKFGYLLRSRFILNIPSLGASGAVFAVFSYYAMINPHAQVSLIFIPFIPFNIQYTLIGAMLFDFFGIIYKFTSLGHLAHLTGSLYGLFYSKIGINLLWLSSLKFWVQLKKIAT